MWMDLIETEKESDLGLLGSSLVGGSAFRPIIGKNRGPGVIYHYSNQVSRGTSSSSPTTHYWSNEEEWPWQKTQEWLEKHCRRLWKTPFNYQIIRTINNNIIIIIPEMTKYWRTQSRCQVWAANIEPLESSKTGRILYHIVLWPGIL